jgi:hypothetical protein
MLISLPNDGTGFVYHVIDLAGLQVHSYRDLRAAARSLEGDQRLAIFNTNTLKWMTDMPAPIRETERPKVSLRRPECSCCGAIKDLYRDYGSGGPYRCHSSDCIVY